MVYDVIQLKGDDMAQVPSKPSAATICKKAGFKSLRNVSKLSGIGESTLYQWYEKKPTMFNLVVHGLVTMEYKKTLKGLPIAF